MDIYITRYDQGINVTYIAEVFDQGRVTRRMTESVPDVPSAMIGLTHQIADHVGTDRYELFRGFHPGCSDIKDPELAHIQRGVLAALADYAMKKPMAKCLPEPKP